MLNQILELLPLGGSAVQFNLDRRASKWKRKTHVSHPGTVTPYLSFSFCEEHTTGRRGAGAHFNNLPQRERDFNG